MASPDFIYTATITLRDADAAGILFFSRYFALAHDAYEAFLEFRGLSIAHILKNEPYLIPVVRAQADYKAPLRVGDKATIRLTVREVKRRSFTLVCELFGPNGKLAAIVQTTHVAVDKASGRAIPLARPLVQVLKSSTRAESL